MDRYGDHAPGGVVATLLGKGVQAYVLIDQDASHAARTAICQTAEQARALTHPKGPRSGFVASRGKVRVGRVAAPVT